MNILNISGILPAPIEKKKSENDILLEIANHHENLKSGVTHHFVLIIPYSNLIFSLVSSKWREYRVLRKQKLYNINGRNVYVIAVPAFRNDTLFKRSLNYIGYWYNRKRLLKIIEDLNVDILHSHNIDLDSGIASLIARNRDIPYVITTRNLTKIRVTTYVKTLMNRASALISLSQKVKHEGDRYNEVSVLIPHGISDEFLQKSNQCKCQLDGQPIKLVTIGRLLKLKNIDIVIRALAEIDRDFIYDIYGDGPEFNNLKELIFTLSLEDKINLKGRVKNAEISEVLGSYTMFIMVSFPETFGRVYIEAMACGVPIIASKYSGIADYVLDNTHGFLVDHENREQIKQSIIKLADPKTRANMSMSCHSLARRFSWNNIIENLHAVYKKVQEKKVSTGSKTTFNERGL